MLKLPDIDSIINLLTPESRDSLYILSVPNLLNDFLAEKMLISTGKANGNSHQLIEELRSFPIWHNRTMKTWVFDADIREFALKKLNGSGVEVRQKVISTMKEYRKEFEKSPILDIDDLDLQIARLSLDLEESRKEGIQKIRMIFDKAYIYNQQETKRVINLYIEEKIPESLSSEETLPDEICNVYFMRGLYAYNHDNFGKAIQFLVPVWKKRGESDQSMRDAAVSSHLVGLIWSKESSHREKAEDAYRQSLELGIDNITHLAQVYHSLGNLLSKDSSRWKEAEEAYKQSLKLGKDNITHLAQVYHSLGNLLKDSPRWKEAEEAYKQSLKLGKNNISIEVQVYHSLGTLLSKDRSRGEEAEDAYKQSLKLGKNDNSNEAQVYHSLGTLLSKDRSRWKEAEDAFKKSLILDKDIIHLAQVYHSLGNLLSKDRSRWKEAEDAYKESLKLLEIINDPKGLAMISTSYGRFLINKKDYSNARVYLQKALHHEKNESYREGLMNLIRRIENN